MSRFGSRFGSSDTTAEATSEPRSRFGASSGAAEADPPKESRFGGSGGDPPPTRSRFGRSSDQPSGEESQGSKIGGDRSGDDTGSRRSRFGGGGGSSQDQNEEERKPSRFGQTDTGAGGNNSSSEGRRGGSRFGGGGDADDNRSDQPRSRFGNRDDGNRGGGSRFERNSEDRGDRQQNRGDREQGGFRGNRDEDRSDFRSGHNEHDDRSERPPRGGDGDRGERPARGGESGEGQESRPRPVNYVPPERPTERDDLRKKPTTTGPKTKGNVPIPVSSRVRGDGSQGKGNHCFGYHLICIVVRDQSRYPSAFYPSRLVGCLQEHRVLCSWDTTLVADRQRWWFCLFGHAEKIPDAFLLDIENKILNSTHCEAHRKWTYDDLECGRSGEYWRNRPCEDPRNQLTNDTIFTTENIEGIVKGFKGMVLDERAGVFFPDVLPGKESAILGFDVSTGTSTKATNEKPTAFLKQETYKK